MNLSADSLAALLRSGELAPEAIAAGLGIAFVLGAIHALSPGHGKTLVAAYLVGTRGTPRHALLLGSVVTLTHTASVFALGIATLFISESVSPDKIAPVLGVAAGVAIVLVGLHLLITRVQHLDRGHTHVHAVPSQGSLIALGASGGLVPCPSALVLMLSAIALGRAVLGLALLVAFSLGLAAVLVGIGLTVLYAKHLLPSSERAASHWLGRYLPVASAVVIIGVGALMTAVALGVRVPGLDFA
ncbi:MAG: sulfite exporter TauE/SafE family protein [Bryobacterales bacterium]|nr:sulfite exporter TauE/SafE family protein [Bryobacterales bacterium]